MMNSIIKNVILFSSRICLIYLYQRIHEWLYVVHMVCEYMWIACMKLNTIALSVLRKLNSHHIYVRNISQCVFFVQNTWGCALTSAGYTNQTYSNVAFKKNYRYSSFYIIDAGKYIHPFPIFSDLSKNNILSFNI